MARYDVRPPPPFHGRNVSASKVESATVRLPAGDFAAGTAVGTTVGALVGATVGATDDEDDEADAVEDDAELDEGADVGATVGALVAVGCGGAVGTGVGVGDAHPARKALNTRMSAIARIIVALFISSSSFSIDLN